MPKGYIKSLKGPFDETEYVAIGGVNGENIAEFMEQGYIGVGFGSNLVPREAVEKEDWTLASAYVARLLEKVKKLYYYLYKRLDFSEKSLYNEAKAIGGDYMLRYNRFPDGKIKCFTLSYDDGGCTDRKVVEILNRFGVKGTFHLNSAVMGRPGRLGEDEVTMLYKGHEIATHSLTHPTLTQVPVVSALQEVFEDRKKLEQISGNIVRGMSYPHGAYNDTVFEILRSTGIVYSRTVRATQGFAWPENFLAWHPTCHHRDSLERATFIMRENRAGAIFYVWGHGYEFDRDNNWELLETLCRTMTQDAGEEWYQKADCVWHATNIEIYEYITAVRNLVVSADETIIYNPSAIDVWVEKDGEPIQICGGETHIF